MEETITVSAPRKSPSTRRAWIEIHPARAPASPFPSPSTRRAWIEIPRVNQYTRAFLWSPSTRRAWIEISLQEMVGYTVIVALHPEGVDRNQFRPECQIVANRSPSTRRAWIEMDLPVLASAYVSKSPSTRRAWIEITRRSGLRCRCAVALHPEGVDRNHCLPKVARVVLASPSTRRAWIEIILVLSAYHVSASPSTRRAWIEMTDPHGCTDGRRSRPPPGGRG